jgi:hypothetical protein
MSLVLAIQLVRSGQITAEQLIDALELRIESRPQLGQLALQEGMLSLSQLFEVLAVQRIEGKAFGEIAVERQFMTRAQLATLLLMQREREPDVCEVLRNWGLVSEEELSSQRTAWSMENRKRETIAIGTIRREMDIAPASRAAWKTTGNLVNDRPHAEPIAAVG